LWRSMKGYGCFNKRGVAGALANAPTDTPTNTPAKRGGNTNPVGLHDIFQLNSC